MPTSTKVYVVLWDQAGYGYDTVSGVFYDEYTALEHVDLELKKYSTGRYVRADYQVIEKEIY